MIVICEECGKKYRIDPSKIKGSAASFKCRVCTHVITVSKPEPTEPPSSLATAPAAVTDTAGAAGTVAETSEEGPIRSRRRLEPPPKRTRFGVRAKMFLLFLFIPLILMAGASVLYLWQLDEMSSHISRESAKIVQQMAEEKIADLSAAVARQCGLYLAGHPDLQKENFANDMSFKTLAVQKVGLTGYTAFYELPDSDGIWRTWVHPNSKIIGIDMSTLKKPLGRNFPGFWKIFSGVRGSRKSQGYYTWQDKDESFRDKFMVCTPVAGTPYVVAATTYLDEFTGPMKSVESRSRALTLRARMIAGAILGATLLLVGIIVAVYGHRLTGRIRSLTEVAERISVGELDMEVQPTSRDEIGELTEAISRMQDSIRLSIERLRRRR